MNTPGTPSNAGAHLLSQQMGKICVVSQDGAKHVQNEETATATSRGGGSRLRLTPSSVARMIPKRLRKSASRPKTSLGEMGMQGL